MHVREGIPAMATRYSKTEGIVEREIRGEHILVPLMRNIDTLDSIYTLNEVAGSVWRHAVEGLPAEQIALKLSEEYEVDEAVALQDTRRVLSELVSIGALHASNE
jgi:hypothetical protein